MAQEPPVRLLLVDDSKVSRDALERRLQAEDIIVEGVATGGQALERLREPGIDLVLLDMTMPQLDGIGVLREIRESYPASELPIIMLADRADSHGTVHALSLGASDFVTKPIAFPVAVARVRTQIGLVRAQRDLIAANRKVRELAEQLRLIMDSAPSAILTSAADDAEAALVGAPATDSITERHAPSGPPATDAEQTASPEPAGGEQRKHRRRRVFKGGKVSFNNGSSVVDCVVRDLSEDGARLEFESYFDCPHLVRLHITGGEVYDCEVRWFANKVMGVRFLKRVKG